jgi:hypothetical protein
MKKRNIKYVNNRILEISEDSKQITLPDSRYYRRNGEYYPSITHVLGSYPKGKHFEEWLKNMGRSADYIVRKAAEDGTKVHEMIEEYLEGKEMNFLNQFGNPQFDPNIWQMFLRFVFGIKPDKTGILWLKSSKRKGSKDKMQGKGWEMVLPARTQEENIEIFKTVKRLFDLENPNEAPVFTEFKTQVKKED